MPILDTPVWEAPPERAPLTGRPSKYEPIITALQGNPGNWLHFADEAEAKRASGVSQALKKRYGAEGFEFASRGVAVYGRFNPPAPEPPTAA